MDRSGLSMIVDGGVAAIDRGLPKPYGSQGASRLRLAPNPADPLNKVWRVPAGHE
jgi:hypothetical protein